MRVRLIIPRSRNSSWATGGFPMFIGAVCLVLLACMDASAQDVTRLTNTWSLKAGTFSDSTPAIGEDGTVYFGTFHGELRAVSSDGSLKWEFQTGREIKSSPAIAEDGTVYVGSRDRKFYAVGSDGKKKWHFQTGAWVDSSPAVTPDGTAYFGSWDKQFYALKRDGSLLWKFPTGGPIVSSPAVDAAGVVYFGSHDGNLFALNPDGSRKWAYSTGGPIQSSPALNGDQCLYFTSVDGFLYALNFDGTLRWRLHTGGFTQSSPVIGVDGVIYVGANTNMLAVTPQGRVQRHRSVHDLMECSVLVLANNTICFTSRYGLLVNEDASPRRFWDAYAPGSYYASPVVAADGTIYVTGWDGESMSLLALPGNQPLAPSSWPKFRGNRRNTGCLARR